MNIPGHEAEIRKIDKKFQFPSNGKARVNRPADLAFLAAVKKFQFPSNGKARVNFSRQREVSMNMNVSIPFKREGTCELVNARRTHTTGPRFVSIPFKREGTCEQGKAILTVRTRDWFQFPSNGKARVN